MCVCMCLGVCVYVRGVVVERCLSVFPAYVLVEVVKCMTEKKGGSVCHGVFLSLLLTCVVWCALVCWSGQNAAAVVDGAGQTPSFELRVALCQGVNFKAERGGGVQHAGARAE